jgi:thiamine-phosphate pyrophosphorylase
VLEEFAKLVNVDTSRQIEGIRYTAYDVLASLQLKLVPHRSFLASAKLYLLIDCSLDETSFAEQVDALARAGVDIFQIRDKQCDDRKLMRYLRLAKEIASKGSAKVIVNDRADLAMLCEADGVHVGQEDMPCREVKRLLGSTFIVGVSTHDVQQVRQAVEDGADYIGCGPTFPTTTKSFDQYAGLPFLLEAAAQSSIPAFAIGGIQLDNLPQVLETGMQRVAVSSGILKTSSPIETARQMKQILDA